MFADRPISTRFWSITKYYYVFYQGRQVDGQDRTAEFTNYPPGQGLYKVLENGKNGAFVEPRVIEQQVDGILGSGTENCQGRGCDTATLVIVDLNTKAWLVGQVGRNRIWAVLGSNFSGF